MEPLGAFPDGFLWGAAAAAHQVEGGNRYNDWWQFELASTTSERSADACEHYRLYELDFDLAKMLNHNAHRLSIEWSRVQRTPDTFDADAIDHYRRVLEALRFRGIEPIVTLHHVTNPVWLSSLGGWRSPKAPEYFEAYARRMAQELGDLVGYWITISEPTSHAFLGHGIGYWPPQQRGVLGVLRVLANLAEGHRRAYEAIHSAAPEAHCPKVGASTIHIWWRPKHPGNRWQQYWCDRLAALTNFHFSNLIEDVQDFYGLNYYFTFDVPNWIWPSAPGAVPSSDLGWRLLPEGLSEVVRKAYARYGKPILVTEHGLADADDEYRWWYARESLRHLRHAIGDGVIVTGYLHWSLTDNYEWRYGYAPRFGLVSIDYATQRRTVRESARRLSQVYRTNHLVAEDPVLPSAGDCDNPRDSDRDKVFLTEYALMRNEIDKADQWLFQLIFYAPWAAAVVLWFGMQRGSLLVVLSPLALLTASSLGILSRAEHQMRITAYIRERIYRKYPELGFESYLLRTSGSADIHLSWATFLLYGSIAGASLWQAGTMAKTAGQRSLFLGAAIGSLLVLAIGIRELLRLDRRSLVSTFHSARRHR